jgi:hypothetical protein
MSGIFRRGEKNKQFFFQFSGVTKRHPIFFHRVFFAQQITKEIVGDDRAQHCNRAIPLNN